MAVSIDAYVCIPFGNYIVIVITLHNNGQCRTTSLKLHTKVSADESDIIDVTKGSCSIIADDIILQLPSVHVYACNALMDINHEVLKKLNSVHDRQVFPRTGPVLFIPFVRSKYMQKGLGAIRMLML
eukprot:jgi/Botrbrau1/9889/Bobra.0080s0020.1